MQPPHEVNSQELSCTVASGLKLHAASSVHPRTKQLKNSHGTFSPKLHASGTVQRFDSEEPYKHSKSQLPGT